MIFFRCISLEIIQIRPTGPFLIALKNGKGLGMALSKSGPLSSIIYFIFFAALYILF